MAISNKRLAWLTRSVPKHSAVHEVTATRKVRAATERNGAVGLCWEFGAVGLCWEFNEHCAGWTIGERIDAITELMLTTMPNGRDQRFTAHCQTYRFYYTGGDFSRRNEYAKSGGPEGRPDGSVPLVPLHTVIA
jgi:hypothetical protein